MRFLMVTSFYPPHHFGGDATYVRQLSKALVSRGHKVDVVCCYDAYRSSGGHVARATVDTSPNISVTRLASRFGMLSPLISQQTGRPGLKSQALKHLFKEPYDVVHFHNISLMGGPAILKMSRAPVTLLTAHDHWLVCASHIFWKNNSKACDGRQCLRCQVASGRPPQLWRHTRQLEHALTGVDQIFAPSAFTRQTLLDQGISRPISVQPLFAPTEFDTLAPYDPPKRPGFLFVGRVTRSKGIGQLAALFRQRPQYDLNIVGDGDFLAKLKAKHQGAKNIRFLGRVEQSKLPGIYRNATASMLPSIAPETFGLTTIEAFSQATPAIVRDAGAAGETVRKHGAGFIYSTDADAMDAMDKLANDPGLRTQMGQAAHQAYRERYREIHHLDAYIDDIRQRLDDPPAGAAFSGIVAT